MKYEVTIGYMDFIFNDRIKALDFAEEATRTLTEDKSVTIKITKEESEEK